MTTAFATLLIGVAGAASLLALSGYWWVNRTPSGNERFDEYGRVPLFGSTLGAGPGLVETEHESDLQDEEEEESDADVNAPPQAASTVSEMTADPSVSVANPVVDESSTVESANGNGASFAPTGSSQPVGIPHADARFADPQRAEDRFTNLHSGNGAIPLIDQFSRTSPPERPRPPESPPTRPGWGATPGWPVTADAGAPPTPKYVSPLRSDAPRRPGTPPGSGLIAGDTGNGNGGNGVFADGVPGSMIEGHQLRFSAPAEGTLQFLPGRLQISTGLDTGREIRFVRVAGPNGTEVTFGRNEGPLYRHIQLRDQTVSREHARLVFADGNWVLTNLSKTNPVAYNGRILRLAEEQLLGDGDRLEMGEVVFNFRSR